MTTALLVFGTALFAFAIGSSAAAMLQRDRLIRSGESFPCRVRSSGGAGLGSRNRWLRGRARAMWVRDVLVLQRGHLVPRTLALSVRLPDDAIREAGRGEVRGLGRDPLIVKLRLEDGPLVEVAGRSRDSTLLAGPFLAAVVTLAPRSD